MVLGPTQHLAIERLLKVLPLSRRISRQKLLKRLRREIDTLRALDGCASAIAFEGAFESAKHVYLVMDVCHGGDIETLLKVRRFLLRSVSRSLFGRPAVRC